MSLWQKMIKYFAIFIAGCFVIVIITFVLRFVAELADVVFPQKQKEVVVTESMDENEEDFDDINSNDVDSDDVNSDNVYEEVENLKISSGVYKIHIFEDSSLKKGIRVVLSNITSDCNVTYSKETKTVEIEEEKNFFNIFGDGKSRVKGSIDIYVAEKTNFKEVDIKIGVGNVSIEDMTATRLDIECGVGTFSCNDTKAETVRIRGGVGNVDCEDVIFKGLSIEGGVGDINVEGELYGKIGISAGMGDISIDIDGNRNEYSWSIETGLGSVIIDGEKCEDTNFNNNSQNNLIDIKGGVGTVTVDFN